eukprot:364283-Chlamydomonas_euryale.AAC.17
MNQAWAWMSSTPRLPGRTLGRVAQDWPLPPRREQDRVIRPTCWGLAIPKFKFHTHNLPSCLQAAHVPASSPCACKQPLCLQAALQPSTPTAAVPTLVLTNLSLSLN